MKILTLMALLISFSAAANKQSSEIKIAYNPSVLLKSLQEEEKNKGCGKVIKHDFGKGKKKCSKKKT